MEERRRERGEGEEGEEGKTKGMRNIGGEGRPREGKGRGVEGSRDCTRGGVITRKGKRERERSRVAGEEGRVGEGKGDGERRRRERKKRILFLGSKMRRRTPPRHLRDGKTL